MYNKKVSVEMYLRVSHETTNLAVFLWLNALYRPFATVAKIIQDLLRPSNFRKRELASKHASFLGRNYNDKII